MTRYETYKQEKAWIERQTDAEFSFSRILEAQGVTPTEFMAQWKLSLHQFNVLAHWIYGVNDEEVALPPALHALLIAFQSARGTADPRVAA